MAQIPLPMAVLQVNDLRWVDIEVSTRGLAQVLDCSYVPYPLGSRKPMEPPKPSSQTEKHLYMLLPHAIGIYPPAQNFDLVFLATMSATTFFEYALKKLGMQFDKPAVADDNYVLIELEGYQSKQASLRGRLVFTLHYYRVPHTYSKFLSEPDEIPLTNSTHTRDVLARLHHTRYMVKKVRGLNASADPTQPHAPSSAEYRACIYQLIMWAFSCGILSPRLKMLSAEMLVFCVDQAYADLDLRETDKYMWRSTVAKLIKKCMYPKVLGVNAKKGHLYIFTPSGRRLGFSAIGVDNTSVATETIKRAITRDMTSVSNIAMNTAEGQRRFKGEHEMYLKIILRCWDPKALPTLSLDLDMMLTSLSCRVIEHFEGAVKTRIWPFSCRPSHDVTQGKCLVSYMGLSEVIVERNMDFCGYLLEALDEKALEQLNEAFMDHEKFDRSSATVEIQMRPQAEFFGMEVELNTGLNVNDGIDFEAVLGVEGLPATEVDLSETGNDRLSEALPEERTNGPERLEGELQAEFANPTNPEPPITSSVSAEPAVAGPSRPHSRFRTAAQAMHQLKLDPQHADIDYEVGYKDRFGGTIWKPMDTWQLHTKEEDFIPEHRIVLLRKLGRWKKVVWSKSARFDGTGE